MRRHLLAIVLTLTTLPALAAMLETERLVAPARFGAAPVQVSPSVATDGQNFFLTWNDNRDSTDATQLFQHGRSVAQRVDGQGHVLDVPSLQLPLDGGGTAYWDGTQYVVANHSQFVRVVRDGTLLDPAARNLPAPFLAAASNGKQLAAILSATGGITVALLDGNLNPVHTAQLAVTPSFDPPVIASNGDGFLVAYTVTSPNFPRPDQLWLAMFDRNLNLIRNFLADPLPNGVSQLQIASDGANYLVLGITPIAIANYGIANFFVGVAVSPTSILRSTLAPFGLQDTTWSGWSLAWTGSNYELVNVLRDSQTNLDMFATPITSDGGVLAPVLLWGPRFGRLRGYGPTVLARAGNRNLLISSPATSRLSSDVFDASADFVPGNVTTVPVGYSPLSQETIAAATNSDGLSLVTWREPIDGTGNVGVYAARVGKNGVPLDSQSILLSTTSCSQLAPAVASNGHDFLVAWSDRDAISARRISAEGKTMEAQRLDLIPETNCSGSAPGVASNGQEYLVAWSDVAYGGGAVVLRAARITNDGFPLDLNPAPITGQLPIVPGVPPGNYGFIGAPHVASDGTDFLVAFSKFNSFQPTYAVLVTAAGNAGAETGFSLLPLNGLVFDGHNYVAVAWDSTSPPLGNGGGPYHTARMTRTGTLLDGTPGVVATSPTVPGGYSLVNATPACDASGCTIAGAAWANGILSLTETRFTDATGAFLAQPRTETVATIPSATDQHRFVTVLPLPGPTPRLVYVRNAPESPYGGTNRIFVRTTSPTKPRIGPR